MKAAAEIDLYKEITNQIIEMIEAGNLKFESGWANCLPYNATTGNFYKGVNVLMLLGVATKKGYEKGAWLTYKQAQASGGNVRKGEKGAKVSYFDKITVKDEDTGEEKLIHMLKSFTVFNIEQCDNLDPEKLKMQEHGGEPVKEIEEIEEIAAAFGVKIAHCESLKYPCYIPAQDEIRMPTKAQFKTTANYYATLLHELVHSTGHESRLNREFGKRFGSQAYAFEELIAELGAAFLCSDFGLIGATVENHAAYLQNWLQVLKNDKKAIFTAASQASKAAALIRKGSQENEEEPAELQAA
jgi:hypothetical protein